MISYFTNLTWPKLAKITWILIGFFIALVYAICLFKYFTYAYNYLDLSIFNQVFYNSANGRLFAFTIHPSSYLGDHFELIIFFLIPFYSLWQSPLCLLLIQVLFAGFSAIPLYLIAKKHLSPWLTFFVICLYLFNPATINYCLYDFHILPLAIFFILWAFYFYDQNKFWPWLAFCGLSLIVREDVALIIFMFSLIALLDRKKIKWILTPAISAGLYFFLALKIIAYFSPLGHYKFLGYYGWLGNSLYEIALNFFLKFPTVLGHIFMNRSYLALILSLFLIMIFLPLYRPKYLLLAAVVLFEFILGPDAGLIVIQTHYGALFLPAMLIAAIFALEALAANKKVLAYSQKYTGVIPIILSVTLVFNLLSFSPLLIFVQKIWETDYSQVALKNEFAKKIPAQASLLTGFRFIETLSGRKEAYPIHYVFFNQQQYSLKPYVLPDDLQYILLDFDDFWVLDFMSKTTNYSANYFQGDEVLRQLLVNFKLIKVNQNLALWQKNTSAPEFSLYEIYDEEVPDIQNKKSQPIGEAFEFLGSDQNQEITSLYFRCLNAMDKNYFITLDDHYYPLGYGIYPTSAWQVGQIIKINYYNLPKFDSFRVVSLSGYLGVGDINAYTATIEKTDILGQADLN